MLSDLLHTDLVRTPGLLPVGLIPSVVLLGCQTLDGLQSALDSLLVHLPPAENDPAVLKALCCLHYYSGSHLNLVVSGVEVVNASVPSKANAYHFFHAISPSVSGSEAASRLPTWHLLRFFSLHFRWPGPCPPIHCRTDTLPAPGSWNTLHRK